MKTGYVSTGLLVILILFVSGCGYTICRSFGNTSEQCAYDCYNEPMLDKQGQRIPAPYGQPGDYETKEVCTYNLRKVLLP